MQKIMIVWPRKEKGHIRRCGLELVVKESTKQTSASLYLKVLRGFIKFSYPQSYPKHLKLFKFSFKYWLTTVHLISDVHVT